MTNEEMILADLRSNGPRSPRDIETKPPQKMSAKQARVAIQSLLDKGHVVLDHKLRLAPVDVGEQEVPT